MFVAQVQPQDVNKFKQYSSNYHTIYMFSQTVSLRMISQLKQTQIKCSMQGLCMHITAHVGTKSTINIKNTTVCHIRSN